MLILDAGAFIAVEQRDRELLALMKGEQLAGRTLQTCASVVAQVWRGGAGRQAPLAMLLNHLEVKELDEHRARRAGTLLTRTGTSDVVDAAVVCLAADGDDIVTSDPDDLRVLAEAAGVHLELIPV